MDRYIILIKSLTDNIGEKKLNLRMAISGSAAEATENADTERQQKVQGPRK